MRLSPILCHSHSARLAWPSDAANALGARLPRCSGVAPHRTADATPGPSATRRRSTRTSSCSGTRPQPTVERLDEPVIRETSGTVEVQPNLVHVRPLVKHLARKLAATVHSDLRRIPLGADSSSCADSPNSQVGYVHSRDLPDSLSQHSPIVLYRLVSPYRASLAQRTTCRPPARYTVRASRTVDRRRSGAR